MQWIGVVTQYIVSVSKKIMMVSVYTELNVFPREIARRENDVNSNGGDGVNGVR